MTITLLHLTDIHAGPGELKDEDLKDSVPEAERRVMLDRLTAYVRSLPEVPDYVAVTGDITIKGSNDGLKRFRKWLDDRINERVLPDAERIMVLPGNHDVQWKVPRTSVWQRERYQLFGDAFAKAFPHSHLPGYDPPLDYLNPSLKSSSGLIGGLKTVTHAGEVEIEESFPFILDLRRDILIFGFNSTLGCGVYLDPNSKISTALDALLELMPAADALGKKLREVADAYRDSLLIDAGMLGDAQLAYFAELMSRLRKELGSKYKRLTKIALLHHHVSHLWRQQLEVKRFESVLDASHLKQRLVEYGFDIVLHGHKHLNHVGMDASVIPLSESLSYHPLYIVSGGTVGGHPRTGDHQSFKLIEFKEDIGPRTVASIAEVPLVETGDPGRVINQESKIYAASIASQTPRVHDFRRLKKHLDDVLREKSAPELAHSEYALSGARAKLAPAHPDLVIGAAKYDFDHIIESPTEGTRVFYYLILATREIEFRDRARIYWMLNDVKHFSERSNLSCRVILLIGNFDKTSLREAADPGRITYGIRKLQQWFKPAIDSGLFEVRVHTFDQDEVDAATRSTASSK